MHTLLAVLGIIALIGLGLGTLAILSIITDAWSH